MTAITWKTGKSGNWNQAADWSTGGIPGAADDATINASGTYTIILNDAEAVHSLTLAAAGAHVSDSAGGTLALGATLSITAGTFTLAGGEIIGGTISAAGGSFVASAGTLASLTYQGTLNAGNGLTLDGAMAFTGAGGTGAGVLNLNAAGASFYMQDATSLNNVTVNLGSSDTIYLQSNQSNSDTLTLGAHSNLVEAVSGSHAAVNMYAYVGNTATFVNQGTITASAAKGSLEFYATAGTLANAGTISISNGDTVQIDSGVLFSNTGSVSIGTGSTLALNGNETTADISSIVNAGTLSVGGTLNNAGATLTIGSSGVTSLSGTVAGGTIVDSPGKLLGASGTLSGVSYDGTLSLAASGSAFFLAGTDTFAGASGTGTGSINLTGSGSALYVEDNTVLDNANLTLGSGSQLYLYSVNSNNDTLTLGSHFNLVQSAPGVSSQVNLYSYVGQSGTFINQGTITEAAKGGVLTIFGENSVTSPAMFSNAGSIAISNGGTFAVNGVAFANTGNISIAAASTLDLEGTETTAGLGVITNSGTLRLGGALNNAGATLTIGGGVTSLVGTITGGTIIDTAGALSGAGGTLSGVSYDGTLNMSAGAYTYLAGGNSFSGVGGTGAGIINLSGGGALYTDDNTILDNATLTVSNGSALYLASAASNDDTLTLGAHFSLVNTAAGAGCQINLYGDVGHSGTFINQGTITAAANGGVLAVYGNNSTSYSASFTNAGSIAISNGGTLLIQGVAFANTGSISIATGSTLDLDGTETTAGLGAITNAGTLQIGGTLTNTATTLTLGTGTALSSLYLTGTISGGTIVDAAGTGFTSNSSGGNLAGVSYDGTLNVNASNYLLAIGGLAIAGANGTGAGVINIATELDVQGGITGAGTINDNGALYLYDNTVLNGQTINLAGEINTYESALTKSTLTLGSSLVINALGAGAQLVASSSSDSIINQGRIAVGSGASLGVANNGTFTNQGSIVASAGGTVTFSSGKFTNLAAGTLTGGSLEADAGSVIQLYQNANLTTLAANLTLSGAGSALDWVNSTSGKTYAIDTSLTTIAASGALHLLAGRNLTTTGTITDGGLLQLGGGTFKAAALTVSAAGSLSGFGTLSAPLADAGRVEASGGTLLLSGAITGAGLLLADTGATLEVSGTTSASETFGFNGQGGVLRLDNAAGFASPIAGYAAGDVIGLGTLAATSESVNGTLLSVGLSSGSTLSLTLAGGAAAEHVGISADGHSLTAYRFATASLHTPEPLAFGNHHVGDVVGASLSLTNTAAADGFSERLDASLSSASAGVSATGSFIGLAAGATDGTDLVVGLSTSAAGSIAGTATITLSTDGTGVDGTGATSLGAQTVNVSGAVYAYAAGGLANGGTLALGEVHVGAQAFGALTLTNTGPAGSYTEALDASLGGASAGLSAGGSLTGLAAGATDTSSLNLSYSAAAAGAYTGTATLNLSSDGAGIDGLGTTALANQTVTVTGAAYAYASAQVASTTINLGVVHTGSVASQALMLSNAAAANGYSEALDASLSGGSAGVTLSGSLTGLAAGASSSGLAIGLSTASSGSYSGTATLGLVSDGAGIDTLGTTTLTGQTITVTETVDNYAVAAFQDPGGPAATGTSTNETINLGSVTQGAAALTLSLGALNAAIGLSDLLQGSIITAGATGFTNSGFGSFSGLAAGAGEQAQRVSLSTSTAGTFTETVVLSSSGTNASGYNGALANETLTITGTITPSGTTSYVLAVGPNTITGADGGDIFQAGSGALNSHDSLTGGNGANVLQLAGTGSFDIGAPKVFTNIQTINAHEGQAASGTLAATNQTLFLRDGTTEAVKVAAGAPAAGNTGAETIAIYDGNDNDSFTLSTGVDALYLGAGTDTVTLGGAKNSIVAGGGGATINGTALQAVASVVGTAAGLTTLNVTSAGIVALNAADTYVTVNLVAGSKLTLGAMGFITANGGAGKETILAGGANQALIGGATDVLTGYTGGSDTFLGASAALNGDTFGNWTTGDMIDITDMNSATLKALTFSGGKLGVSDGTHTDAITVKTVGAGTLTVGNFMVLGTDGHGGTLIGWHA